MPRPPRADEAGGLYHALNRGNARTDIFRKDADFEAFEHYHSSGEGHVYQGRFKSFPVQDEEHFFTVCRYVERNAVRAKLVKRAEDWRWGSLWRWLQKPEPEPALLSAWPIPRLPGWVERVYAPLTTGKLTAIRTCAKRGSPFGEASWVESSVKRLGLESTSRARGCPQVHFPAQSRNKES